MGEEDIDGLLRSYDLELVREDGFIRVYRHPGDSCEFQFNWTLIRKDELAEKVKRWNAAWVIHRVNDS